MLRDEPFPALRDEPPPCRPKKISKENFQENLQKNFFAQNHHIFRTPRRLP